MMQILIFQWKSFDGDCIPSINHQASWASRKKRVSSCSIWSGKWDLCVYVVFLESPSQENDVHSSHRVQIAALVANEAPISIPTEYSDFANVFSPELASELPEYTGINDHAIKLVDDWQPPYGPIYSLGPIELETLKTYIETNLANGFIKPSKSLAGAPIFFDKKPNGSFWLYVDYHELNNLIIKNRYLLPLVGESLDW